MTWRENRVPGETVRTALLQVLPTSGEPATVRELATAVYHHTGDDRVSSSSVRNALSVLEQQKRVERLGTSWRVVPS